MSHSARSPATNVAALLRDRREDIVARWATAQRDRHPELSEMDRNDLVDSLPSLVDELAEHLASHSEDARFDEPILATAAEHGAQRVSVHIPLSLLVEEYAMLRRILTAMLAELHLAVNADEMEQLHAALDASIRRSVTAYVATSEKARDRLMGIVGHDLRNPLNAIVIGAEALRLRLAPDTHESRIAVRIGRSSENAVRMIRDLLDYSQASSHRGAIPIHRARADLAAVVGHVVEEMRLAFPDRVIAYETNSAGKERESVEGVWDPDRIAQVVSNLIRNALQHSLAAKPVTVRTFALDEEQACVEVHNEGEPIAPDLLPRLFEPFQQGEPGAGRSEGNLGLGLYIAHEVVRGHGGRITVDSRTGAGTTFRVTLPRSALTP